VPISKIDELVKETWKEYEQSGASSDKAGGFNTRTLETIASNLCYKEITAEVTEHVENILDRHLTTEGLIETGARLDGGGEHPPCYTAFVLEVLRDELTVEKPRPGSLGDSILYCFDRDETVETGVPPGPVPLSEVKDLHDKQTVYATGNPRLKKEADIPGAEDIYDGPSTREQDIRRVCQKEEKVDAAVAIDDTDVSDVDELDVYYEPWEFYLLRSKENEKVSESWRNREVEETEGVME